MRVFHGINEVLPAITAGAVTIGNFDGVHLGHQKLLREAISLAKSMGGPSVVVTFYPHPLKILAPERGPKRLFSKADLMETLERLGVDILILQPFSREFSQTPPMKFLEEVQTSLRPKSFVVGYDFHFGANRQGGHKMLEDFCRENAMTLKIIGAQEGSEGVISSTHLRNLIFQGRVLEVSNLLGRHFYVEGMVERGDGRGRSIGIPTANIRLTSEILPKIGVYATRTRIDAQWLSSVTNIGRNPTFKEESEGSPLRIETHILDFTQDIYGRHLRVEFFDKIREEKKFSGAEELVAQIHKDILLAKEIFEGQI